MFGHSSHRHEIGPDSFEFKLLLLILICLRPGNFRSLYLLEIGEHLDLSMLNEQIAGYFLPCGQQREQARIVEDEPLFNSCPEPA